MALVPMTIRPSFSLQTALSAAFLLATFAMPAVPLAAQAPPPAAPASGQPAKAPAPSPLDKPVFDALKKYQEGDAAGALAILEPHKKEIAEIRPLAAILGAIYVDAGKPQEGFDLLSPIAAREDADAPILYNAGRAALALGKTNDARTFLMRSVAIEPASPASRELGLLLAREGKVVEAYRSLRPWAIRSPRDFEARLTAAALALQLERPFEAEELLYGESEDDPSLRLLRAKVAIQKGEGPAALALLQPIAAKHPAAMDLEIRRTQAEAYLLADSPAEVIPLLSGKAANSPALALLLARAQRQTKNVAAALATLQPFAEKLPTDPKAVGDPRPAAAIASEYGQILAAQGKAPEALVYLERATLLNPLSPEAFAAYGDTLQAAGRVEQAKVAQAKAKELLDARAAARQIAEQAARELREAVAVAAASAGKEAPAAGSAAASAAPQPLLSPEMQEALRAMSSGDKNKAIEIVRKRIKDAPDDLVARNLEVRILMDEQRFTEALAAAEASRRYAPDNADMVYQQAAIEMVLKRLTEAEVDFRRALALQPNHVAAMSDLAVLLTVQGKKAEAEKLLRRVLEINPRDAKAKANLDRLYKE